MKDAENAELDAIREKKAVAAEKLNKIQEDYNKAFVLHSRTLKFMVLAEKRANDNAFKLKEMENNKEVKQIRALEV